jgi:tRNA threonylcarbamoyl adenosine modification protein YeaZ
MRALILETSTEKGLIVLSLNGTPIASLPLVGGPDLSRTLALHVKNLLKTHSFMPTFIAVGTGPGSYTGIRVGAALAKALGFGWQIPIVGFCSLKAFQHASASAVLIDARMGGFYILKNFDDTPSQLSLEAAIDAFKNAPILASPHPDLIQKRLSIPSKWVETAPDPALLASLANELFLKGEFDTLKLSYLSSP